MVPWSIYILTFLCIFTFGALVGESPRAGAIKYHKNVIFDFWKANKRSKTNVCVVCAGAKAILNIGLTLEYLETKGVPVIGYKTSELPAFYSSKSGFNVDYRIDSAIDIAEILKTKWDLSIKGGVLVANPIPIAFELESVMMNEAINEAIIEANKEKIIGKEITPYLLSKVNEITQGKSLNANIKLIQNNAALAAKIAIHYMK